jgi:hypothetical protein
MDRDTLVRGDPRVARATEWLHLQAGQWRRAIAARFGLRLPTVLVVEADRDIAACSPDEAAALLRARGEDRVAADVLAPAPARHLWYVVLLPRTVHVYEVDLMVDWGKGWKRG